MKIGKFLNLRKVMSNRLIFLYLKVHWRIIFVFLW